MTNYGRYRLVDFYRCCLVDRTTTGKKVVICLGAATTNREFDEFGRYPTQFPEPTTRRRFLLAGNTRVLLVAPFRPDVNAGKP